MDDHWQYPHDLGNLIYNQKYFWDTMGFDQIILIKTSHLVYNLG